MTPERLRQVRDIFEAALERPPEERQAFLEHICGVDRTLRSSVQRMLIADAQIGAPIDQPAFSSQNFIDRSVLESITGRAEPALPGLTGTRIGPYEIGKVIGSGGMATVYLADRADDSFRQRVAFKVIRHGIANQEVVRRFQQEREILAALDHPNIARLMDGGTTDNKLPYFVMEYIEGTPIDQYCDDQKLNVSARLKLFQEVCSAVSYAHRNLIVHRDLKPSNILVTADGRVKLLDFGIAKVLNAATSSSLHITQTLVHALTPRYASPEQIRGETISTASDIYSLGVILYELLTGHPPYRVTTRLLQEISRVICEQQPIQPSTVVEQVEAVPQNDHYSIVITPEEVSAVREGKPARLRRRLSGDVDNILLMALRKEPYRRFTSVDQFSEDIRRHLDGLPVVAQRDTYRYRVSKFLYRHQVPSAAGALILVSVIGGAISTQRQAVVARLERSRTEVQVVETRRQATLAREQTRIALENSHRADVARALAEQQEHSAIAARIKAETRLSEMWAVAEDLETIFKESQRLPEDDPIRRLITQEAIKLWKLVGRDGDVRAFQNRILQGREGINMLPKPVAIKPVSYIHGWMLFGRPTAAAFEHGIDKRVVYAGRASAYLKSKPGYAPAGGVVLAQVISAEPYRGGRVRLSAMLRAKGISGSAALWMKVEGRWDTLTYDVMEDRRIQGSSDWIRYVVVLDVPESSAAIHIGIMLERSGELWADDVRLERVGAEIPTTGSITPDPLRFSYPTYYPTTPMNPDFEGDD